MVNMEADEQGYDDLMVSIQAVTSWTAGRAEDEDGWDDIVADIDDNSDDP